MKYLMEKLLFLENLKKENIFYHGSNNPNLKILEPKYDKRLNVNGLFVSDDKYSPMVFSLMKNRYNTSKNLTTKDGKFISGKIITSEPLNDVGYLYHIKIDNLDDVKKLKSGEYILNKPVKPFKKEKVTLKQIKDMGWKIEDKNNEIYAYHYFTNHETSNKIIQSGKLKSLSVLPMNHPEREKYKGRPHGDMDDPRYYNKTYRDILKKEYTTFGIYFTTVDLFTFPNKMIGRVKIPINYLVKHGDVTFEHGPKSHVKGDGDVILVKSERDIQNEVTKYPSDGKKLSKLYFLKNKVYLFENLTQVVLWSNYLPITKDMVETR